MTCLTIRAGSNTASEPRTLLSSPVLTPIGLLKDQSLRFVMSYYASASRLLMLFLPEAVHHPLPAYTQDTIHPITGFHAPYSRDDRHRLHRHGYSMDPRYLRGLEVRTPRSRILRLFGGDRGGLFIARANLQDHLSEGLQRLALGF
jgi:hypothetical protein